MITRGLLWLGLRLGLALRCHNIEWIALRLFLARLARLTAPARLATTVLVAIAIAIAAGIAVPIILITIILVAVIVTARIIIVVALVDPIAEALIAIISNIIIVILDLVIRTGITTRLIGLDQTEIMLGVLVEILGSHAVARQHRIACQLNVFVKNLGSIAADFNLRTIALIAAIGRITRLPPTAALALVIARPCFPAIHI